MKRLVAVLAISFLLLFTMTLDCFALVRRMTKEEVILKSQEVIHGIVTEVRCDWNEDHSTIYTYVTLQVLDVFMGEPRDEMVVLTLGGTVGDKVIWVSDQPELKEGMEVIIHAFWIENGYFGIRGLRQGVYVVNNGVVEELNMTIEQFRNLVTEVKMGKDEE